MKLFLGLDTYVFLSKPEYVEAVLSSRKLIEKGDHYSIIRAIGPYGLFAATGDKWRPQRKLLTPVVAVSLFRSNEN